MKKTYVAPVAEKINFEYKDQVVVASGVCYEIYSQVTETCPDMKPTGQWTKEH